MYNMLDSDESQIYNGISIYYETTFKKMIYK